MTVLVAPKPPRQGEGSPRLRNIVRQRQQRDRMAQFSLFRHIQKQPDKCRYFKLRVTLVSGLGGTLSGYMSATCRLKSGESDRVG